MKSKRDVAKECVDSLLRSWRTLAVEHLNRRRSEAFQDLLTQTPIIAQKMSKFVGNRETLFIVPISPIDKGNTVALPRYETGPKWPILAR
jgi:hypothetical protein